MRRLDHERLARQGIILPQTGVIITDAMRESPRLAMDALRREPGLRGQLANDALPLTFTANAAIPAYLANLVDPETIRALYEPMRAAEAYGETQKGNWTTRSIEFRVIESTGYVSSYGDYSENGRSGHNVNFVYRQSYHFQTFALWGEMEEDTEALAGINYVSEQNTAAALNLAKFMNKSHFYGVSNILCYGALNDPSLFAPITPTTKTGGPSSTSWGPGTPPEQIYADIQALYVQLLTQMGNNLRKSDAMTLIISPDKDVYLENANSFGTLTAAQYIKRGFPNLKIVTAPEMDTGGGSLAQLRVDKVAGQDTTFVGFTVRMRNHAVIQHSSSWSQKKSAGTWGFIMRFPIALAQMLGI